jgi:hypothetical protein
VVTDGRHVTVAERLSLNPKGAKTMKATTAPHGEKMIEVKIRFWTNDLGPKGQIIPKHAWDAGAVRMEPNAAHGITSRTPIPFNSLLGVSACIEKLLLQHGIVLHSGPRAAKYTVPSRYTETQARKRTKKVRPPQ